MWNANSYIKGSKVQSNLNEMYFDVYNYLIGNKHLDIGCGPGTTTTKMAQARPETKFFAIDKDANMIKSCKENQILSNIDYTICRAENITEKNKFNSITSLFCLHWVKDIRNTLQKIYDSLKDNGYFFMIASEVSNESLMLINLLKQAETEITSYSQTIQQPLPFFSRNLLDYIILFEQIGFNIKLHKSHNENLEFKNIEDYCDFLKGIPLLSHSYGNNEINKIYSKFKKLYLNYSTMSFNNAIIHPENFSVILARK